MYSVIITILAVLFLALFLFLFCFGGYLNKVLVRFGLAKRKESKNWAVLAWESCLNKLEYKADVAFLGDSITRGSNFEKVFDKKIVNLGMTGDTLEGMIKRVPMVSAVRPEKLFILGGINSLCDRNIKSCVQRYDELVTAVKKMTPDICIMIQSVLPVSDQKERTMTKKCSNETISKFNEELKKTAQDHGAVYIDLHSAFIKDGVMNPELTKDGLHLNDKGYSLWTKQIEKYI